VLRENRTLPDVREVAQGLVEPQTIDVLPDEAPATTTTG
jgi:hypothetical protein